MTLPMNQHTSRSPKGSLRDKLTAEAEARTRYARENELVLTTRRQFENVARIVRGESSGVDQRSCRNTLSRFTFVRHRSLAPIR
jgi:hypothetical protein